MKVPGGYFFSAEYLDAFDLLLRISNERTTPSPRPTFQTPQIIPKKLQISPFTKVLLSKSIKCNTFAKRKELLCRDVR